MDEWGTTQKDFIPEQVESILTDLGLRVVGSTETAFLLGCPFHYNPGSPAFAVNKTSGLYYCHNPSCNQRGTLAKLIASVQHTTIDKAHGFIDRHAANLDYAAILRKKLEPFEFKEFDQALLGKLREQFPGSEGEEYMMGRGFHKDTLEHFGLGYSSIRTSVIVPMQNVDGLDIGFVARNIYEKRFENSEGLPKKESCWNMNRAKRFGGPIIVVESSFDAMKVHQAGFPNVVALLGGSISDRQVEQLERYATQVVIFTDNDEINKDGKRPGRELGFKIEQKVNRVVTWACIGPEVYPRGVKDATDLTDLEIRQVLEHPMTGVEYREMVS